MTVHEHIPSGAERPFDQGNRLTEDEIQKSIEFYLAEVTRRTSGPQLEGIEPASLKEALREDPNMVLIDVMSESGEKVKWPLLTPIEHHIDYSNTFFRDHYPTQPSYFFALPPHDSIEGLLDDGMDVFTEIRERLKRERAILAYDFLKGREEKILIPEFLREVLDGVELEDITPESRMDGVSYGLPKVVHYEGFIEPRHTPPVPAASFQEAFDRMVGRGRIEEAPENGVVRLTTEKLEADNGILLDQIWGIYNDQFNTLTEDHPSLQKQPREELERMLKGKDAVNIAYMSEGRVAGLLYFVHDMESCVWLNKDFYDERYDESKGWLAYYPGIVVDKEKARQGIGYAHEMIGVVADALEETGMKMAVTFQCTNVSMTYIPKITEAVIEGHPKLRMVKNEDGDAFTQTAEYNYRVVQVI